MRLLQETELELQVLTGGQLDAITLPSGDPLLLREAQEKLHVAEAAQRITAETQIAILNALPAHIALLDAQGVILTVNESWRRFASANMPQSADFFVGQNYLAVCEQSSGDCAEEAQDVANGIRRVLSGETPMFSLEYPCHSLTEQRWFRLMVTPLSLGTMTGAVVMHVNVTERLLAEEDLRKNQQRLELEARRLHESQAVAHVGSWETDLPTQAVTWTEETHRIFGTNPAAFSPTHESFLSFVHLDDRARVEAAFAESHGRPEAFSIEHRICLADGTIKHVEERWQAFNDDAGRPIRAVGTCQDITARKLVGEALRIRARQQEVIARIGFESMRATTLEDIFDFTTRVVAEALDVEMCKVLQLTPDGSRVRLVSGVGWQPGLIGVAMVEVDVASQAGFTLKSDGPIFVNDLRKETRFQAPPLLTQHNVLSGLSVTIPLLDKPWGVLGAHCRSVRNFDEQDAQFMQSVAALLAVVIERLAAQRSVSESERRMRDAQRIAHLGNWELAIAPNRLMWSDEAYRIFGVTPETFAGTYEAFLGLVHPEDRQAMDDAHRKALTGEGILEIDHRILLPGGEIRHVRERAELIHDENGQPVVLAGTVLDITVQVLAQKTHREAEERSSAIVASALDGIITLDHENRILEFNPSAESIFGWPKAEVLGRDMGEVIIPERLREGHRRGLARYLESGEKRVLDRRLELPAIRADGTEILIELNATRLGQSLPAQFTAFVRDITQQKRAEQALTETQERYRSLVESSHDVIYTVSPEGQILFINEASRSVLGYAPEELIGRHWVDLIPADRRQQDLAVFAKIIKSGDGHADYLAHVLHKDGSTVAIRANSRSLLDNEGKLIGRT
ncbi:PAS domain S-box protein, partial [Prosthecobacter sp.]|uniref:PAS domain S-box protein n=1 Tax=Prosthecobacter sp. TaxID=1965333 RepID=UPI002487D250